METMATMTARISPGLNEVRSRRPEQSGRNRNHYAHRHHVSMKSGLGDRNNEYETRDGQRRTAAEVVSMKSGLGDRNNLPRVAAVATVPFYVSMKSGLGDRNNEDNTPRRMAALICVSMKSGLGDRNNGSPRKAVLTRDFTKVCERSAPQAPAPPLC